MWCQHPDPGRELGKDGRCDGEARVVGGSLAVVDRKCPEPLAEDSVEPAPCFGSRATGTVSSRAPRYALIRVSRARAAPSPVSARRIGTKSSVIDTTFPLWRCDNEPVPLYLAALPGRRSVALGCTGPVVDSNRPKTPTGRASWWTTGYHGLPTQGGAATRRRTPRGGRRGATGGTGQRGRSRVEQESPGMPIRLTQVTPRCSVFGCGPPSPERSLSSKSLSILRMHVVPTCSPRDGQRVFAARRAMGRRRLR